MIYVIVAWLVIGQLLNAVLGIKGIAFYLVGLFLLVTKDGYQVIEYMQFANVVVATTILLILLIIAIFIRKKIWGNYNLPVHNLILTGVATTFIVGSLTRPSLGLMSGGAILAFPIGRMILLKGVLGIIQLYSITLLQWTGLFLINFYLLWNIIKKSF